MQENSCALRTKKLQNKIVQNAKKGDPRHTKHPDNDGRKNVESQMKAPNSADQIHKKDPHTAENTIDQ